MTCNELNIYSPTKTDVVKVYQFNLVYGDLNSCLDVCGQD